MDSSVKKFLVILAAGFIAVVTFFNMLPYVFTSLDLESIKTPSAIEISGVVIEENDVIEKIYDVIRSGRLREDKVKVRLNDWGKVYELNARYDGEQDYRKNSVKSGHIFRLSVSEKDIVNFEYSRNDSDRAKDYRVANIKAEGIFDLIKSATDH